jgi:hypothetical protein
MHGRPVGYTPEQDDDDRRRTLPVATLFLGGGEVHNGRRWVRELHRSGHPPQDLLTREGDRPVRVGDGDRGKESQGRLGQELMTFLGTLGQLKGGRSARATSAALRGQPIGERGAVRVGIERQQADNV